MNSEENKNDAAPQGESPIVTLEVMNGEDTKEIKVEQDIIEGAILIKGIIDDSGIEENIPCHQVNEETINKVISYLKMIKGKQVPQIAKPLKSTNFNECVEQPYCDFINMEQDPLFELMNAANHLNIQSLIDLCGAKVASMMKGKTLQ